MAWTTKLIRAIRLSSNISNSTTDVFHRSLPISSRCCINFMSTKATDQPDVEENKSDKTVAAENNQKDAATVKEDKTQEEIKKLSEDLKEHKEKYMRSLAEAENMRKRLTKQTEDAKIFGIQSFCKDLLEVSDVLSTAINAVPKDQLNASNPHLVNLYQGLDMTESQLLKVFKKHGLVSISPKEGEKFDPHVHEAMFQVPIQSQEAQEPDTVAAVQKIGFKLHERTLRPAQVGVFKGS